jgi:hypothetical protein
MNSKHLELPMETTHFDHEWTSVEVKVICVHIAAAICLAVAIGMSAAQLVGDSSLTAPAVTSSPDASNPDA